MTIDDDDDGDEPRRVEYNHTHTSPCRSQTVLRPDDHKDDYRDDITGSKLFSIFD